MKAFAFAEEAKKADSGSYLKLKEGNNVVRLVTEFLLYESSFQGKPTRKFVGFVIDRADGAIKPAFLAKTIIDAIADLQLSGADEYGFEGVPMPYDINIKATNAGTKEVIYSVIPAKAAKPLTEEELKAAGAVDVVEFITQLRQEQGAPEQAQAAQKPLSEMTPEERQNEFDETFGKEAA